MSVTTDPRGADERRLTLYLNDHLTGAVSGSRLCRRAAAAHAGEPEGRTLGRLADQIAEDRRSLVGLLRRLGLPVRRRRIVLGWAAEAAGRLKTNGRVVRRSPLSDLMELEALRIGVEGKRSLWRALLEIADSVRGLDRRRLEQLAARAADQAEELDDLRDRMARRAFDHRP